MFDAVVNAFLCHMFPDDAYVSLLTTLYDGRRFPECFLRPAPGWKPNCAPAPLPEALVRAPSRLGELHRALYSAQGVTYGELRDSLAEAIPPELVVFVVVPGPGEEELPQDRLHGDRLVVSPIGNEFLGDHRDEDEEASSAGDLEHRSPVLFEVVREIVELSRRRRSTGGPSLHCFGKSGSCSLRPRTVIASFGSTRGSEAKAEALDPGAWMWRPNESYRPCRSPAAAAPCFARSARPRCSIPHRSTFRDADHMALACMSTWMSAAAWRR